MHSKKTAVLLVNLGSPDSPEPFSVFKYLNEFLTDKRVIDFSFLKRQALVRGLIVPLRFLNTTKTYQAIWKKGDLAPLLNYTFQLKERLSAALPSVSIEVAMRYQAPSIKKALEKLKRQSLDEIIVVPLYPQYSSACNGSVTEEVMNQIKNWEYFPKISFLSSFYDHPLLIKAFTSQVKEMNMDKFDHILFSFHGLPERQVKKVSPNHCLVKANCCSSPCDENKFCYRSHCVQTASLIAKELSLSEDQYTLCFQSRLGKEKWLTPYTSEILKQRANKGENLLVFCPSFVCDCLETSFEIEQEYREEYLEMGGKDLTLVPGLNSSKPWVECLKQIIIENSSFVKETASEKEILFSN
ncbi:MAG: ferrochelatase [Chlamydiales bacterium]|nr:ferrochelatase [Chlamydiales bacterium]